VADVLDVIRELGEGGMTMLVVEQAPPGQLFSQPSDERTRRFLRRIVDAGRLWQQRAENGQ
jgi:polar amino acid transport system ATP-binding protein